MELSKSLELLLLMLVGCYSATLSSPSLSNELPQERKLELLQVVFRNGERTPYLSESYPYDVYASSSHYDAWGRGRLTDLGKHRMRRLGLALRHHYAEFLGKEYRPEDVYTYSIDREYSRISAQLVLRSMYPSNSEEDRAPQPIKIKSPRREIDMLMHTRRCSRYREELRKLRTSPEVLKRIAKYEGLYRYLTEKAGLTFDHSNSDERLYQLYDLLESQRSLNLSLPEWCPEGVMNLLNEIAFLHFNLESQTESLRRLNGGPLLRRFLETMKHARVTAAPRTYLYSGGGHTIAAFARALNKRYPRVPNYGSAVIVEKRTDEADRAFVKIMIWTGVSEKIFPIQIKGCAEYCPLEDFTRLVGENIPTDKDLRCLLDDLEKRKY